MKDISKKTLAEHRDYLYEIVKLKLFFLHHFLAAHPEEAFSAALRNRVDIYRKTDANRQALNPTDYYFDVSPWIEMEKEAERIYLKYKNDEPSFEREAFEVFRPSLDARLVRDYEDRSGLDGYQCGSLRHELRVSGEIPTLGFHIANAIAPHSIFEDRSYLVDCFRRLCDVAERDYHALRIGTSSWLNQNPLWLTYFPAEWRENMQPPAKDVQWHYGFWGQFISARGTYNRKLGDFLRKNGTLPYYPCYSCCSIAAMRKHLEK